MDALIRSLSKFADKVKVQEAYEEGGLAALGERRVGPSLIFGRLWEELWLRGILEEGLSGRRLSFPVERAVFASVLHRLFESGSDRQAHRFLRDLSEVREVEWCMGGRVHPAAAAQGGGSGVAIPPPAREVGHGAKTVVLQDLTSYPQL